MHKITKKKLRTYVDEIFRANSVCGAGINGLNFEHPDIEDGHHGHLI